eukprot:8767161-Pyramimonas_sp.AAC.1
MRRRRRLGLRPAKLSHILRVPCRSSGTTSYSNRVRPRRCLVLRTAKLSPISWAHGRCTRMTE